MLYVVASTVKSTEIFEINEIIIIDFFMSPKSKVYVLCLMVLPF